MIAMSSRMRILTSEMSSPRIVTGCAVTARNCALSSSLPSGVEHRKSSARISLQRFTRRLQLTPAGAAYLPSIAAAFEEIAGATSRLTAAQALLQVSAPPSFAARWLLPRLERFRARHPGTELAIEATMGLTNFRD